MRVSSRLVREARGALTRREAQIPWAAVAAQFLCVALVLLGLAAIPCFGQTLIATVQTGQSPVALALNPTTNRIYVVNQGSNSVTVIDGATNNAATIMTGIGPNAVAVNAATNKIYVANGSSGTVTVIDGSNNRTATIRTGTYPDALAVNALTNKIYVANYSSNTVTVIDGATNSTSNISVGRNPAAIAVQSAANKIFVADYASNDVVVIDGATNSVVATVTVGAAPRVIAGDQGNKLYVANYHSNTVSVIDTSTYHVATVAVGGPPISVAVDPVHNKVFVANSTSNSGTVIDTSTLSTSTITSGDSPLAVQADAITDKVYFANALSSGTTTMTDPVTGQWASVPVGQYPTALALNPITNRIYIANTYSHSVSVIAGAPANPLQFVPLAPCRIADTRLPRGPFGGPSLPGGNSRSFAVPQSSCHVSGAAVAYSLNVTVVPAQPLGYLTIWPTGEAQPVVSTLNSPDGRIKANAAIVPAGDGGAVSLYVSDTTDVILDIDGYFRSPSAQTLQFYSVPLCRVLDTRTANGDLGGPHLQGGHERDFPVQAGNCQLPGNAQAYSMNFTVTPVDGRGLGYLTVWPAGGQQPLVSTLNNPTATVVANAAIVPAGSGGAIAVYADQDTNLIADVNGYFAAPGVAGLSLYPLPPCRVIDTRQSGGAFSGQRSPPVDVAGTTCGVPGEAQEYVFNATVVPVGPLGYLTLWADGDPMPGVSNLNAIDGVTASNMAIIGNHDGKTDAYAYGVTQLILDIASYFAP